MQGLDIGSKLKYRGVTIGEVTSIGFTYNKYQQDEPMALRARYVLVEAQIEPRLLGGRAGAGDITSPEAAAQEVERGLRVRLAPQGITGTSYLEIDYVDPPPPVLPIDWVPDNIYIPSTHSTVAAIVNAVSDIIDRLAKLDIEGVAKHLNQLLVTTNSRIDAIDTKTISQHTERVLSKLEKTLDNIDSKKLSDEGVALLAELRKSNAELNKTLANPALQKLPDDAAAAIARARAILDDPNLTRTVANLSRTLGAARPDPGRRRSRSRKNDRQSASHHRQPARPDRGDQALSGERPLWRAAAPAGAQAMTSCRRNTTRRAAIALALGALAFVAGCSFTRSSPVKETYLLAPAVPPAIAKPQPGSLRVGAVNVAAPFRARNFVVRDTELQYESDFYHEFIVPPGADVHRCDGAGARRREGVRQRVSARRHGERRLGARRLRQRTVCGYARREAARRGHRGDVLSVARRRRRELAGLVAGVSEAGRRHGERDERLCGRSQHRALRDPG